jgi:hypothetical protein
MGRRLWIKRRQRCRQGPRLRWRRLSRLATAVWQRRATARGTDHCARTIDCDHAAAGDGSVPVLVTSSRSSKPPNQMNDRQRDGCAKSPRQFWGRGNERGFYCTGGLGDPSCVLSIAALKTSSPSRKCNRMLIAHKGTSPKLVVPNLTKSFRVQIARSAS